MALPVALQLYSVRDDFAADMEGTLKKVKEMGYAGVEFAGLNGKSAAEIKAACEAVGLVPISAHVPIDELVAKPEETVKDLRRYRLQIHRRSLRHRGNAARARPSSTRLARISR